MKEQNDKSNIKGVEYRSVILISDRWFLEFRSGFGISSGRARA